MFSVKNCHLAEYEHLGRYKGLNLSFHKEWEGLAARIEGLQVATRLFFESIPVLGRDYHGVSKINLIPAAHEIFSDLRKFSKAYERILPARASEVLTKFLLEASRFESPNTIYGIEHVPGPMVALSVFRTEFDRVIRDAPTRAKSLIIRAFSHLQRLIVANKSERQIWESAFKEGEPSCEKLGATHLLMHGIWAFKASAEGERTDLVLGGPLRITDEVEASA